MSVLTFLPTLRVGHCCFPLSEVKTQIDSRSVNDFFLFVFPKENLYESFLCWAYLLRSLSHSPVIIVSYNVWEIKHWLHVIIQMNLKLSISHEKDKGGSLAWFDWDFLPALYFCEEALLLMIEVLIMPDAVKVIAVWQGWLSDCAWTLISKMRGKCDFRLQQFVTQTTKSDYYYYYLLLLPYCSHLAPKHTSSVLWNSLKMLLERVWAN